jgi:hypothetical protein
MSSICLMDTSVFLNLMDVPNRNNHKAQVQDDFKTYALEGCTFILPMATIIETGNHIAQNGDGSTRRKTAQIFVDMIKDAFSGAAPFQISELPSSYEILTWLDDFPNHAGRNKSPSKTTEGTSFGDLSIIKEFDKCCGRFAMSEVRIWSLDSDLQQYHQHGR